MKRGTSILIAVLGLLAINGLSGLIYERFDLTEDKRYTLSAAAVKTVETLNSPVVVDILLDGNLPAEFARLQSETVLLLEQFQSQNKKIHYNLVNPLADGGSREGTITALQQLGLKPANISIREDGKLTQEIVFPWAMANYNNKTVKIPLLKNNLGASSTERINNSVQNLEYAFADAFTKLTRVEKKKIAVLKGNGELGDPYLADFLSSIREYYNIGAFTLDSVPGNAQKALDQLRTFDLALIAKPTEAFSEEEKYVLDQFIVQGGKSLWLLEQTNIELDSLFNDKGSSMALRRNLNLDDYFFKQGIRVNSVLVNDLYNTPIVLATGEANDSQFNPLPWVYYPMVFSKENHAINTNIEAVRFQFANTIDTLSNTYRKTVLLQSSPLSKTEGVPRQIKLDRIGNVPQKEDYPPVAGYPLAVLLEGTFSSSYTNRVKPLEFKNPIEQGPENKMIVIADGDLIKNQLQNGRPLELGYDKWTSSFYGNKEFLINCTNYLLDDTGLINIRNKKVAIPQLDIEKIVDHKLKWQLISIGLPVVLILLGGWVHHSLRKRKFTA